MSSKLHCDRHYALNYGKGQFKTYRVLIMTRSIKKEYIIFVLFIFLGICLRFFVMTLGHNFDFESYCIVGEISGDLRNVYAETSRYNYGPVFLVIQGLLYNISSFSANWELTYRVLMVSTLTLTDLGITCIIAKRYDTVKALIFFLNPVSIFITGYHNQFDNIAVLFALISILFYNEEKSIGKKDVLFIAFLSLSIITKHILFIFPLFLLLRKALPVGKKLLYAFVPPILFLLSFLPFALQSNEALNGIINNVFLYKSFNNSPLLSFIYDGIGFPTKYSIVVFGLLMVLTAFLTRKKEIDKQLLVYLIALVAFSSAIANQYLAIPLAAIIILDTGVLKYIYMAFVTVFLFLHGDGLGIQARLIESGGPDFFVDNGNRVVNHGYTVAAWILFIILLYELFFREMISRVKARRLREKN